MMLLAFVFCASALFAQDRRRQIELFAGAAIPLAPDTFKDYYKVGGSLHGQYVIFPSPNLGVSFGAAIEGFTVDQDAVLEDYGLTGTDATIDATASIFELGVGVRPYLTPPTANTQIFLFGMGTYNALTEEVTVTYFGETVSAKGDASKVGVAAGAGFELPAGEKLNIIIQGLTRFIFTEGSTTSFMGVTLGVVF
jgi:hypothetical protein